MTDGGRHELQRARNVCLHLFAMHNGVKHPVLEEKFATLESRGKLLSNGLFDHARTGEADQRSRLGNIQIAKHGERSGDASSSRVRKNGNVWHASFIQTR